MNCPKCGIPDQSHVVDSRHRDGGYTIRRRVCVCGHKFNTIEIAALNETSMSAIRRESNKNGGPRLFESEICKAYKKIFNYGLYRKERHLENQCNDS